ncbi:MAG: sulfur oxidation c-type cytochrome SoxA [Gammaproteobacteria bacterium]|nr:sulfur oxidation c-type cytochrome SoxA [Gammaproteobacteria bacterium]
MRRWLLTALLLGSAVSAEHAERQSGYALLGDELRALQDDDFANPGMLWVDAGERLWSQAAGPDGRSCQDCHGDPTSLRGLANRLPRFDADSERLKNLDTLVRNCREQRQQAAALPHESEDLLALTTLIAHQSRGLPLDVTVDGAASAAFEQGRASFERRRGQLDLSCADCHERLQGARLRGETISAGMINGFPLYRLTWEGLGSRQRMIRWCNEAVRAEPMNPDSQGALALELYLAWRGRGLTLETPAVRR